MRKSKYIACKYLISLQLASFILSWFMMSSKTGCNLLIVFAQLHHNTVAYESVKCLNNSLLWASLRYDLISYSNLRGFWSVCQPVVLLCENPVAACPVPKMVSMFSCGSSSERYCRKLAFEWNSVARRQIWSSYIVKGYRLGLRLGVLSLFDIQYINTCKEGSARECCPVRDDLSPICTNWY